MEVLLHTFNRPNDPSGGYLPGDVIQVKPDGFDWRNAALMFRVVRLPDNTFTDRQWQMLDMGQWENLAPDTTTGLSDVAILRSRRYHFNLMKLSDSRRAEFTATDKDVWTDFDAGDVIDKDDANPKFTRPSRDRSPGIPTDKRKTPTEETLGG